MISFKPESRRQLYTIIRAIAKLAMSVFFQKIELRHGENVPKRGPVLFVANHPNSIMDALVMGVVTKRKVNYLGHAGLFSNRPKTWFLRSSGVIPVYRREDALDKMDQNVGAFEACYRALENGQTIGIFPEGTSDMVRKVKKVKTGAARIVLETERRNHYALGIRLIPIGLYFFSRSRFRSKVLVNVGRPIELDPFFELNKRDNWQAVSNLTNAIQEQLEKLTVNVRHKEVDQFVRDIDVLFSEELKSDALRTPEKSQATVTDFVLTQKIAECVEYYHEREPERVEVLQDSVRAYKRKLRRLRIRDEMLKRQENFWQMFKSTFTSFGGALLGSPLALYGIVNNVIPYLIAEYCAKRFIDERTKILSALLVGGGSAFVLFYAIQVFLVWYLWGFLWSSLYFVSLPLAGSFALAYLRTIRAEQERLSFSFFLFTNRQLFNKIRRERRKLLTQVNSIKDEYMSAMGIGTELKATGPYKPNHEAQIEPR